MWVVDGVICGFDIAVEAEQKANGQPVKISNAEQNRIYEEEKRRVWDLQAAALSSSVPPSLELDDEISSAPTPATMAPRYRNPNRRRSTSRAFSRENSIVGMSSFESPREASPSAMSGDGESMYTGNPNAGKVMRIKRIVSPVLANVLARAHRSSGQRENPSRDRSGPSSDTKLSSSIGREAIS